MLGLNFFTEHLELRIIQVYDRDSQPKSVNDVFLYMYGLVWTYFIDKMVLTKGSNLKCSLLDEAFVHHTCMMFIIKHLHLQKYFIYGPSKEQTRPFHWGRFKGQKVKF